MFAEYTKCSNMFVLLVLQTEFKDKNIFQYLCFPQTIKKKKRGET